MLQNGCSLRSPADIFQEIEADRLDREAELRLIENLLAAAQSDGEQRMLRRSLILLAYAHLEGFCKFALVAYVSALNSYQVEFRDASTEVGAASMSDVFAALSDFHKKHHVFRAPLADDVAVHRIARQQTFVREYEGKIGAEIIRIPDKSVNTESNLSSVVLKRNLFALGLPFAEVDQFATNIDALMHIRNAIAHGDRLRDPRPETLAEQLQSVSNVMTKVLLMVYNALEQRTYLRQHPGAEAA